ncbi:MAG: N-acetylmuramoyl-L-alanine amidase [Rhodovarius sp.]|nr:N-acetylmuramoyl-L-alanine amidase [Rhodovarius sp.]MCX7932070.1 N-acetylmuramoyl-L-alanine amidase [Rhodovarius sp.]MDW8316129.1 N-acetylmuramoyl-L-alanine amidase [Rhodovarius sp.]
MIDRRAILGAGLWIAMAAAPSALAQTPGPGPNRRLGPQQGGRDALPLVVIDPGHGGADPGAIGPQGTQEKRVVLAVALELRRRLEAEGRCRVALTRSADVFVPLRQRVEFARRRQAALLLSLHADALPPGQAASIRGASVYTLSTTASDPLAAALAQRENLADRAGGLALPSVSPEVQRILLSLMRAETRQGSERIARHTLAALRGEVPLLANPHRRAGFLVLKAPDVPSALIELGFLSHPGDEALLRRPAWRAKLAERLAQAVHGYLGRRIQA